MDQTVLNSACFPPIFIIFCMNMTNHLLKLPTIAEGDELGGFVASSSGSFTTV